VRTEKKTIKKGVAKNLPLGFIVSVIQIATEVDGVLYAIYWDIRMKYCLEVTSYDVYDRTVLLFSYECSMSQRTED
jgi:hypothetical protein